MRTPRSYFIPTALAATLLFNLAAIQTGYAVNATGGSVTDADGTRIHTFTSSGLFEVSAGGDVEVLVVAGGGGGGGDIGAGGGAGGLIYSNRYVVAAGSLAVTVGAGGNGGAASAAGSKGSDSVFGVLTAFGGGGGGAWGSAAATSGGSGGGGRATQNGAAGTSGQGNAGGTGGPTGLYAAGGGGGASSTGLNGTTTVAGDGGNGLYFSQFENIGGAPAGWFAGGGGGGVYNNAGSEGKGGTGGGAAGGKRAAVSNAGANGLTNTGGGGGGGSRVGSPYPIGGAGGSGIVIVRYVFAPIIENCPTTNVTVSSAWLNGLLVSIGAAPATVSVYWGDTDGGDPSSGLWQATNTWAKGEWAAGAYPTCQATALTANQFYYYRFYAANALGDGWASASERFLAGDMTIAATDASAAEPPPDETATDTGMFTIARDPTATGDALTVTYSWAGTSGLDTGFTPSPAGTSVTLPAGVASTNITITPLWDRTWSAAEPTRTVWLVLQPGTYGMGTSSSNVVTISRYPFTPGVNMTTKAGNWSDSTVWSLGRRPVPGDDVTVKHAVTLSDSTDPLNSFTLTNATLTCSNWDTILTAVDVSILNKGTLTHVQNTDTSSLDGWTPNARVAFVCSNLTVTINGRINVDGKGYGGGLMKVNGSGPGGGKYTTYSSSGAGHGGKGGDSALGGLGGIVYGSSNTPVTPGSGAGGGQEAGSNGGTGGGVVWINASGAVVLNGVISADGLNGVYVNNSSCGGGSGGSVLIACHTFSGDTSGMIRAVGGLGYRKNTTTCGGGGGGGRIAVTYTNSTGTCGVRFDVSAGTGYITDQTDMIGGQTMGTIFLSDTNSLVDIWKNQIRGYLFIPGFTNWSSPVAVSNAIVGLPDGFTISAPSLRVASTNSGIFLGANGAVTCAGDFSVQRNGIFSMGTNGALTCSNLTLQSATRFRMLDHAILSNGGMLDLATDAWLVLQSNSMVTCAGPILVDGALLQATVLSCADDLTLTNGARLIVGGGPMNSGVSQPYAGAISVTGDVFIGTSSWIAPAVDTTEGGAVKITLHDLMIATNAGINANYKGYPRCIGKADGYGPGRGKYTTYASSGAGHGGKGGNSSHGAVGGTTYGSSNAPVSAGSSSGGGQDLDEYGAAGGGALWIEASGAIVCDGAITVNGEAGSLSGLHSARGGGAGGSIFVICDTFSGGSAARLQAAGGAGSMRNATTYGGGGGGGQIAIWIGVDPSTRTRFLDTGRDRAVDVVTNYPSFTGTTSVAYGSGYYNPPDARAAAPGSCFFFFPHVQAGTRILLW